MSQVDKVKPKYLEEMFSILSSIRTFPGNLQHHKQTIGVKLQTPTKVWPTSRFYVQCKKQLNRLLKSWNIKVEFSKGNAKTPPVSNGNGEVQADHGEDTTSPKKKKKKKKKSQEKLKNEKEYKLKEANNQENSDLPSFSEMVQDTLNNDLVESGSKGKRKATDEEVKKKKKKKK